MKAGKEIDIYVLKLIRQTCIAVCSILVFLYSSCLMWQKLRNILVKYAESSCM